MGTSYVSETWVVNVPRVLECLSRRPNWLPRRRVCPAAWNQRGGGTKYIHTYRVPQCLSPRANWHPPPPLAQAREPRGDTLSCGWGGWGSQIGRLEKKPSTLSTLGGGATLACRWRGPGGANSVNWRESLALCIICGRKSSRNFWSTMYFKVTDDGWMNFGFPLMDEGTLKTPISKCCLYWSFLFGVV
jgi:hypothetical protein